MVNKKRKRNQTSTAGSKLPRRNDPQPSRMPSNSSTVKLLAEARGTSENKCFSGLDFNSIANLFKGSDISSVANILYESSSPIDFNFDIPAAKNIQSQTTPEDTVKSNSTEKIIASDVNTNKNIPLKTDHTDQTRSSGHDSNMPSLSPIPEGNKQKQDSSNQTKLLSPTSGLWRISASDESVSQYCFSLPSEDVLIEDLESSISSFNETFNPFEKEIHSQLELLPEHANNCNYSHMKPTRLLSPTTGLWSCSPENENVLPLCDCDHKTCDHLQVDEDLTDCDVSLEKNEQISSNAGHIEDKECITSSSPHTFKILSPTTGLWRSSSNLNSSLDDVHPSTSQLRLSPTSPSVLMQYENSASSCDGDDSVADPNYEEEEELNSGTESDSNVQLHVEHVEESSTTELDEPDSGSENLTVNARKKKANPSEWKRNKTKLLRNSGKSYTTLKKGNTVAGKRMGPPCNAFCRLKCSTNFSETQRKTYFERYWSLKSIDKQRQYISNSMQEIRPKYRYPKVNRKKNHSFYFIKEETKIKVCKKFFTSTLGVTNRCIRTVIEKTKEGLVEEDRRGKHKKHVVIPEEVKNGARTHISSIPVVESHYRRADSTRNYIEGGRNLTDLYKDYKKECTEKNAPFVSFAIYRNIFYYEFNLASYKPKKDMCQFCESFKNMNERDKAEKEEEYKKHHEEKILSRLEKTEDKKRICNNFRVACFDLEAALPTPRGEISTFYYRSKLSTYNFTICDLKTQGLGIVHCYVWHEGEGHKGSNEIGSALLHYLDHSSQEVTESTENSQQLEATFYSDNCGGQGKNKFIIAAYLYAVANFNIKSITHKFLVVGHTQNEGDVSHSLIERNIKKSLKAGPIYLPSQYSTLISTAKKSGEPFKVNEIDHDFFYDLKELVEETSTNFNVNDEGNKFNFNDICTIRVEKSSPGVYYYKTSFKETEYKAVNVTRSRTRKALTQFKNIQLKKAYTDAIPISRRKYQDLQYLVNSNTIPGCHAGFFTNLKHE